MMKKNNILKFLLKNKSKINYRFNINKLHDNNNLVMK